MNIKKPYKNLLLAALCSSMLPAFIGCSKKKPAYKPEAAIKKNSQIIKQAHLDKAWYPQTAEALQKQLDEFFIQAKNSFSVTTPASGIRAIIAPHAAYPYSGLCAAAAYQPLLTWKEDESFTRNTNIKRVVILATNHQVFLNGIAFPTADAFSTPLGKLDIDQAALTTLSKCPVFKQFDQVFAKEHSLEIQLPLIQATIQNCKIVPLLVSQLRDDDYATAAKALKKIIDNQTLVVVSTDFVHHGKSYDYALFKNNILDHVRFIDSLAIQAICRQSLPDFMEAVLQTDATICGREPLKVLLALFHAQALPKTTAKLACYYTSAHMTHAQNIQPFNPENLLSPVPDAQASGSVSYAGLIFTTQENSRLQAADLPTNFEKLALLELARATLANSFKPKEQQLAWNLLLPIATPYMQRNDGIFVTLKSADGQLRGCIGRIQSDQPLFKTVCQMSLAAAYQDTRFKPLQAQELDSLLISISILGQPQPVDSYEQIKIGKHGIILTKQNEQGQTITSAVFLPHVPTEFGWTLEQTLQELSMKAGLEANGWETDCLFEVFEGFEIEEGLVQTPS